MGRFGAQQFGKLEDHLLIINAHSVLELVNFGGTIKYYVLECMCLCKDRRRLWV